MECALRHLWSGPEMHHEEMPKQKSQFCPGTVTAKALSKPGDLNVTAYSQQKNYSGPTSALIWVNVVALWWNCLMESFAKYDLKAVLRVVLKTDGFCAKNSDDYKALFYYLLIFPKWWQLCHSCLSLFEKLCFSIVCASGFIFPSAASHAVGRTSGCLDGT